MDIEQLIKRVEWLDNERRQDKTSVAMLEEKLAGIEGEISAERQKNSDLQGEIAHLKSVISRMDQFDESVAQNRVEFNRLVDTTSKEQSVKLDEITSLLRAEIQGYDEQIKSVRKGLDPLTDHKRAIQTLEQENQRLIRLIEDVRLSIDEISRSDEEQSRVYRILEDNRRQESKRITDHQGEITALRKRSDEQRGRIDIVNSSIKKLETRLNELVATEEERKTDQVVFLEKQAINEVEREKIWKSWVSRFEFIEKQSIDIDNQLQTLDATNRSVIRVKDAVDEQSKRIERRANEIQEMQRLNDDRFRQEWGTFRADDQKRWTNYTLAQEEQQREQNRRFEGLMDRVTVLEDTILEMRDTLQHLIERNDRRVDSLLSLIHEWTSGKE